MLSPPLPSLICYHHHYSPASYIQFPEMHTRHPAGMTLPDGVPTPTPGAVVHAWRPGHWYGYNLTLTLTLALTLTLTSP